MLKLGVRMRIMPRPVLSSACKIACSSSGATGSLSTALAPVIGYDKAAAIAKEAYASGKTVRQVAREHKVLSDAELDRVLDPTAMTKPGYQGNAADDQCEEPCRRK